MGRPRRCLGGRAAAGQISPPRVPTRGVGGEGDSGASGRQRPVEMMVTNEEEQHVLGGNLSEPPLLIVWDLTSEQVDGDRGAGGRSSDANWSIDEPKGNPEKYRSRCGSLFPWRQWSVGAAGKAILPSRKRGTSVRAQPSMEQVKLRKIRPHPRFILDRKYVCTYYVYRTVYYNY